MTFIYVKSMLLHDFIFRREAATYSQNQNHYHLFQFIY